MKKITPCIFIVCLCMFMLINFPVSVLAKSPLKTETAISLSGEEVGSIILYDDYTIQYTHLYRVNNINITVCAKNYCDDVEPQIVSTNTYIHQEIAEFSVADLLVEKEVETTYVITAKGFFKPTSSAVTSITTTLSYSVVIGGAQDEEKSTNREIESLDKVIAFCNKWVIPGIYGLLALMVVVKGVLLCIDLVKYSDRPEIRGEKIRGFVYLAVGVLVGFIINSCVGIITGLFN